MAMQRSVRHLRLRGPSEAAVRRAALGLEDALRTASLPGDDARVLLVRQLRLGTIDADATPASLALAWERVMARADWRCMHGTDARAGSAQAVWFGDPVDAHVALALRLLRGPAPREWFWPLAVPGWSAPHSSHTGLRAIVRSLLACEEAASAVPAWCAALARAGQAARLPDAFADDDLPVLQRLFAQGPDVNAALELGNSAAPVLAGDATPDARTRSVHIAAALLAAGGESGWGAWLLQEQLQTNRSIDDPDAADRLQGRAHRRLPGRADNPAATQTSGFDAGNADDFVDPTSALRVRLSAEAPVSIKHADHTEVPEVHTDWSAMAGEPTVAGGIAFLLPVLQRLGYPEWLHAHPAWTRHAVLQRVLASVLVQLDIADDDPAWAVTLPPASVPASPRRGEPTQRPLPDAVAAAWTTAARRWLRRHVRIGLHDLVRRPARLALTATHLDLHFDPGQADLRLRRHGLDLDPGWLPWFGRVVAFHYDGGVGR